MNTHTSPLTSVRVQNHDASVGAAAVGEKAHLQMKRC